MRTFLATAILATTFAFNFAHGAGEAMEPDFEYNYRDSDLDAEADLIQKRMSQRDSVCSTVFNRKLQADVWLCSTNPFYQYATEDACKSYCW